MNSLVQNCRYALRGFRRTPGFTAVALLSLAAGIGVNTAIFSVFNVVLLKNLPVPAPERLVFLRMPQGSLSYPFYREYRDRNEILSGLVAAGGPNRMALGDDDNQPQVAEVTFVSGNFFETLGVATVVGRPITPSDDQVNVNPVGVLAYGIWQQRFAADRSIVGRLIRINGHPVTIIGVAARGFHGIDTGSPSDLYIPVNSVAHIRPEFWRWDRPGWNWLDLVGRLKPGVSLTQAQASLNVIEPQVRAALDVERAKYWPGSKPDKDPDPVRLLPAGVGTPWIRNQLSNPLHILLSATGLVLLIACANVANLLLARGVSRQREMAVRLSLGATRWRITSQLLTESLILAIAADALGVLLSFWGIDALLALLPSGRRALDLHVTPDLHVLAFTALVAVAAGLLFGLAPAREASRTDVTAAMKADLGGMACGSRILRQVLVVAQVVLSLTLLVGAGLFLRTMKNLLDIDPGFRRENVLLVQTDPAPFGYKGERLRQFYDRLLERTRQIPGVIATSLAKITPLSGANRNADVSFEGYKPASEREMILEFNQVSAGYFATMGIPILLGRDFTPQDEPAIIPEGGFLGGGGMHASGGDKSPSVPLLSHRAAIISESAARHFFGGTSPIGRRFSYGDPFRADSAFEIIGVVKDVKYTYLRKDAPRMIYVPVWMHGAERCSLALRNTRDPKPLMGSVRQAVRDLDSAIPVLATTTLEEDVTNNISDERLIANLSTFFAALSLALASIGLYGVVSYAVTRRTKEFGIRMALGGQRSELLWMVLRESLGLVVVGIVIGTGSAIALIRLVRSLLYGVSPYDPLTIAFAAALLLGTSALAALIPAHRASRVDPMASLRSE
jgi:predicted permease